MCNLRDGKISWFHLLSSCLNAFFKHPPFLYALTIIALPTAPHAIINQGFVSGLLFQTQTAHITSKPTASTVSTRLPIRPNSPATTSSAPRPTTTTQPMWADAPSSPWPRRSTTTTRSKTIYRTSSMTSPGTTRKTRRTPTPRRMSSAT